MHAQLRPRCISPFFSSSLHCPSHKHEPFCRSPSDRDALSTSPYFLRHQMNVRVAMRRISSTNPPFESAQLWYGACSINDSPHVTKPLRPTCINGRLQLHPAQMTPPHTPFHIQRQHRKSRLSTEETMEARSVFFFIIIYAADVPSLACSIIRSRRTDGWMKPRNRATTSSSALPTQSTRGGAYGPRKGRIWTSGCLS